MRRQPIAFRPAERLSQIEAARKLTLHVAALTDAAEPALEAASLAKLFASEMAGRVWSDAIQIYGGYGFLEDFPVEKCYRDALVLEIYEGSSEIRGMLINDRIQTTGS